jgi:hypothetical protein
MLMATVSVDFGTEDGHDFNQVPAELFHGRQLFGLIQDGDLHTEVLADLEDNFASEAEQSVFVSEDEFLDFALEQQKEELFEFRLFIVHAAAQVFDDQIDGFP